MPRAAQFEILTCLVDLCKILRTQLASTLATIREQEAEASREAAGPARPEAAEADPLFDLGEKALLQPAKPYAANSPAGSASKDKSSNS